MGVWTRFPSSFVVGMFSKHGIYVVPKKSKMWRWGGILKDLRDAMYMSINHGETIEDFKDHGRVMKENLQKHRPNDALTNYLWTYYHQFGK